MFGFIIFFFFEWFLFFYDLLDVYGDYEYDLELYLWFLEVMLI